MACDFGAALAGGFDLMISNPPYVATRDISGLDPEVRHHDPRLALDGGRDGIDGYLVWAWAAPPPEDRGGLDACAVGPADPLLAVLRRAASEWSTSSSG